MATQTLGALGLTVEARTFYEKILLGRNLPDWLKGGARVNSL